MNLSEEAGRHSSGAGVFGNQGNPVTVTIMQASFKSLMALFWQEKGSSTSIAFVAETTPQDRGI